jgi:hypothetical protein
MMAATTAAGQSDGFQRERAEHNQRKCKLGFHIV